jgi:hypothetical protein
MVHGTNHSEARKRRWRGIAPGGLQSLPLGGGPASLRTRPDASPAGPSPCLLGSPRARVPPKHAAPGLGELARSHPGDPHREEATMENDTAPPTHETAYDRLAQVFSRVYAETGSIATTLEVLDTQRARELVTKPTPDLPKRVLAAAAALFHVAPPARLLSPGRHRDICSARWIAAWMLRMRNWSTPKIGRFLGLDHSTVLHGLRRVAASQELLLMARAAQEQIDCSP